MLNSRFREGAQRALTPRRAEPPSHAALPRACAAAPRRHSPDRRSPSRQQSPPCMQQIRMQQTHHVIPTPQCLSWIAQTHSSMRLKRCAKPCARRGGRGAGAGAPAPARTARPARRRGPARRAPLRRAPARRGRAPLRRALPRARVRACVFARGGFGAGVAGAAAPLRREPPQGVPCAPAPRRPLRAPRRPARRARARAHMRPRPPMPRPRGCGRALSEKRRGSRARACPLHPRRAADRPVNIDGHMCGWMRACTQKHAHWRRAV